MPFPSASEVGWGGPQQNQFSAGGISPEIMQMIEQENYGRMTTGQQPIEIPATNDPLQFATLLYFNNPQLAMTVAAQSGIPQEALIQNVTTTNAQNQADRRSGQPWLLDTLNETTEDFTENPLAFTAKLGAVGVGTSFLGGGSAATGGGAAGGSATTYPLASGGPITGSAIPGVTSGTTAAGAAAAGIGPAAAGGATNALSGLDKWLPYATTGVNTLLGAHAADSAADAEVAGMDRALAENARQFDLTRSDSMPWITGGTEAINRLRDPAASFTASPGYEWARTEGQRDIGNSFAARGGAASGNALKALSEFNTGLAQQDFGNWWNQQLGLAGMGSNTTANVGAAGSASAGRAGNYFANQGASRASGVMGKYGSLANGLNEGVSNYLYRRRAA